MSISVLIYTVLWIINLFNGTGLDYIYHVTDIAKTVILFLALVSLLVEKKIFISIWGFTLYLGLASVFSLVSIFSGYGLMGVKSLWVFVLLYFLAKIEVDEESIKQICLIYGFLGAVTLLLYGYTSIFNGWNSNSIAMIGMHSYLVLIIRYFKLKSMRESIGFITLSAIYMYLLNFTASRSSLIIVAIAVLIILANVRLERVLLGNLPSLIMLIIPIIVVWMTVKVSESGCMDSLNAWSLSTVQKSFFNGRDSIWKYGLEVISQNIIFGTGTLNYYNWHNSAIVCLVGYGVVGYCLWIGVLKNILSHLSGYINDRYIAGAVSVFVLAYLQKSVEIGLIAESPDILIYLILGIAYGRRRRLILDESMEMGYSNE